MHLNYLNNSNESVTIEENKLLIDNAIFTPEDIDKINIFATYQHFNDSVGVTALPYNDYYYYVEVYLKKGEKIVLSPLIDYKIDEILREHFPSVNLINKISTFALIGEK